MLDSVGLKSTVVKGADFVNPLVGLNRRPHRGYGDSIVVRTLHDGTHIEDIRGTVVQEAPQQGIWTQRSAATRRRVRSSHNGTE